MTSELSLVAEDIHISYRTYLDPQVGLRARLKSSKGAARRRHVDVHAVRGVSFDLRKGESIGIVGSNGAGKSTILLGLAGLVELNRGQVLSRSRPTLLGVGSVLNVNLSGRRNIEIGCLALGMSKNEISRQMDELIDFSGLNEFIDVPLKAYSSGMKARLNFTVATVAQPEILLIDEALAVGDANFRDKATERLEEIRAAAGSVVIVSHSIAEVTRMCDRVIWLDKGTVVRDGSAERVTNLYVATKSNPELLGDLISNEPAGIGPLSLVSLDELLESGTGQLSPLTFSARTPRESEPFRYCTPYAVDTSDAHEVQAVALTQMLTQEPRSALPVAGATLRNWMIHHPSGALMMESGSVSDLREAYLLDETASPWLPLWYDGWDRTDDGDLTLDKEIPRVDRQNELVYCSSRFPDFFTHWWIDVAARVHIALASPEFAELNLILPSTTTKFQRDALAAIGLTESHIYTPHHEVERLGTIHYPGATQQGGRSSAQVDKAVITVARSVRQNLIPDGPTAVGRRLYISRQHERVRKIRNEFEVESTMIKHGFEIVHPDELDFASTVDTFAGADVVVGATGDSMTHIVFCDPGTTIIEVLPDTFAQAHIWALATLGHHRYAMLAGRAYGEGREMPNHALSDNLHIPVDRLVKILDEPTPHCDS